MDRNDSIPQRLSRVMKDLEQIKSTQPVGGDGWVVYRTKVYIPMTANRVYRIDYNAPGNFVAQIWTIDSYGGGLYGFWPDPDKHGRWYLNNKTFSGDTSTTDRGIMIYSTKKATLTITEVT